MRITPRPSFDAACDSFKTNVKASMKSLFMLHFRILSGKDGLFAKSVLAGQYPRNENRWRKMET